MGNLSQLSQIGMGFAGLGAVNSAFAGFGQYESGQQQRSAYDYNAAVTMENTRQQMQTSELKYSTLIGKQASAYARAGVDIASGSPLLIMAHTAAQSGQEQESEFQTGSQQSELLKYYGKVAAFAGTVGGINTFIKGLTQAGMQTAGILGPSSSSEVPTSLIGN